MKMMNKQELREQARVARLAIKPKESTTKSQNIIDKLIATVSWEAIKSVHVYAPITALKEVDTEVLADYLAKNYPKMRITTAPHTQQLPKDNHKYDLIVVPTLAFDNNCNRLGWGGGWYDRFLATQTQAKKIGLCYENGHLPQLPAEPRDIALDAIITEEGIITNHVTQ